LIEEEDPATLSAWHGLLQHIEESFDRLETPVFLLTSTVVYVADITGREARIDPNETI
jgi:hypothetical protein